MVIDILICGIDVHGDKGKCSEILPTTPRGSLNGFIAFHTLIPGHVFWSSLNSIFA